MRAIPTTWVFPQMLMVSLVVYIISCTLISTVIKFKQLLKYLLICLFAAIPFFLINNLITGFLVIVLFAIISSKIALGLNFKHVTIPILISFGLYQFIENIFIFLIDGLNYEVSNSPLMYSLIFLVLIPLFVVLLLYTIKKVGRVSYNFNLIGVIKNSIYFCICLTSFCSLIILFCSNTFNIISITQNYANNINVFLYFINVLSLSIFLLLGILIKVHLNTYIIESKNQTLEDNFKNLKELNKELRALKHDFLNHLQVITGLLQLKKYSDCFNYIMSIKNSEDTTFNIKTGLISLNALLNSKQLRAKHKNIKLDLDINSILNSSTFKMQDWEITNILGNLIDNAIYEENKVSTPNKYIKVKIDENKHFYNLSVYNKNSYINSDKKKAIFDSGFSTKGNEGNGMGLYIVKNIVDRHNGVIELTSNISDGTEFSICFPKTGTDINQESINKTCYPPQESLGAQNV